MQTFFNIGQNPGHSQHGKNRSLITDGRNVKSKNIPHGRFSHADLIRAHQVGMNHDHAHRCPQEGIAAKLLRRAESDEHRQKSKGGAGKQIDGRSQSLPLGIKADDGLAMDQVGCQHVVKAHEKTSGHNGGNDGHKNIAEHFHKPLQHISLFLLCLRLRLALIQAAQLLLHLVTDHIHRTGTKNDLKLSLT